MHYSVLNVYLGVTLVILALTFWAVKKLLRQGRMATWLAMAGILASLSVVAYFARVLCSSLTVFAWMTSLHLIGITAALMMFVIFTAYYTKYMDNRHVQGFVRSFVGLCCVDVLALLVNPFTNIVVDFAFRTPVSVYTKIVYSAQHPLYYFHILLAYVLILFTLLMLIKRARKVPKEFRRQYSYTVVSMLAIMAFNIVSVFVMGNRGYLNYSVSGYCLMEIFMYLFAYKFSSYIMLNYYKESVFENVEQGIVLFDYSDEIVLRNTKAVRMLQVVRFKDGLKRKEFEDACNISIDPNQELDVVSLQCFMTLPSGNIPLRLDFRKLRNFSGVLLGYLYVFSDIGFETDPVTGCHNWNSFKKFALENAGRFVLPQIVVVADINNLMVANNVGGRLYGDKILENFAQLLRNHFPSGSYFVRGEDARLIVLCHRKSMEGVKDCMTAVQNDFTGSFLYGMETVTSQKPDILKAIESATKSLRQKKLLDRSSKHSEIMSAVMRALKEFDPNAENQISHMQALCRAFGPRMKLSDKEQSDLELLCVLCDVGEIGVPKEILKKTGQLTREEWRVVQSHPQRSFEIAKSSNEFRDVADLALHHHERWDGKGYPDGLSGEQIPFLSRVLCVVDAFCAMMSPRPYRQPLSKEVVVKELRACAGTQFDPAIVAEFLQVVGDFDMGGSDASESTGEGSRQGAMASRNIESPESVLLGAHVHKVDYSRYILDEKNRVISVDENFERITGYSRDDIRERQLTQGDLIPSEDLTDYLFMVSETLSKNQLAYFEHRMLCKDGSMIYVFCMGRMYYDSAARENRSEIIFNDNASTYAMQMMMNDERKKAKEPTSYLERKDSLTGLLNESSLRAGAESRRLTGDFKMMVMAMDVDGFKSFNDVYGYEAGDECLQRVAKAIRGALRGTDLSCRIGGDEFAAALFFEGSKGTDFMYERAQEIHGKIMDALMSGELAATISMGVYATENKTLSYEQMYKEAERALFNAQKNGRGQFMSSASL